MVYSTAEQNLATQAARDGSRGDMACAKPMELESSMTSTYQGQKWQMHKWMDVRDKSYSYWS